eukprot:34653-Eustigmatos_ZCMA.PRE.1
MVLGTSGSPVSFTSCVVQKYSSGTPTLNLSGNMYVSGSISGPTIDTINSKVTFTSTQGSVLVVGTSTNPTPYTSALFTSSGITFNQNLT